MGLLASGFQHPVKTFPPRWDFVLSDLVLKLISFYGVKLNAWSELNVIRYILLTKWRPNVDTHAPPECPPLIPEGTASPSYSPLTEVPCSPLEPSRFPSVNNWPGCSRLFQKWLAASQSRTIAPHTRERERERQPSLTSAGTKPALGVAMNCLLWGTTALGGAEEEGSGAARRVAGRTMWPPLYSPFQKMLTIIIASLGPPAS